MRMMRRMMKMMRRSKCFAQHLQRENEDQKASKGIMNTKMKKVPKPCVLLLQFFGPYK